MHSSVGVEYALHCLVYLIDVPSMKVLELKIWQNFKDFLRHVLSKVFR